MLKQFLSMSNDKMDEYRPLPFWSWNDKLELEELKKQIHWMYENGMGGYFMHARGGLKTPYLSHEWMNCIDVGASEGMQKGMEAWIYDENGWPSGFAGGKLLQKEENRDCYLTYSIGEYDKKAFVVYDMEGEELKRIRAPVGGECLNVYLHVSASTADILNKEVVEQFLQETHEKYVEFYGKSFAEKIQGFFTDEPQYYRWQTAYSRVMPQEYAKRYGEELLDGLGLLFVEKAGYRKFRYRYWYTMQQLMLDSFGKQLYQWCEEHQVKLTGHYVEEATLGMQMTCCAGIMPFYEHMHMPGIDWLGRNANNEIPIRQVVSVAQQMGKKQVLTESFGCCGWDVTPTELRWIMDFQYVGGVNRMCQHLLPYSEHGQRKKDHPVHFSKINPWIEKGFKPFNDYCTRFGYLLANSLEIVNVAMLHPVRSAYLDFCYVPEEGYGVADLDRKFYEQQRMLSQAQIPFHFLDETLLENHGFVEHGQIGCGLCKYDYLVIPTCYTMGKHTEHLIRQYVNNGGKLLLLDEKPMYLEGEAYEYSYLKSNVTFEELAQTLPYQLKQKSSTVHSSLRVWNGQYVLCIQNYGMEQTKVSYKLSDGFSGFEKWDLFQMKSEIITTEVTLKPMESCVLVFSKASVPEQVPKQILHLSPEAEVISATENFLTLDVAQYSKDGISYSEELPCMGIFQQLLEERYQGTVYLKYTFDVQTKPSEMSLIIEKNKEMHIEVNGQEIILGETWERDHQFARGDVSPWIREGKNEVVIAQSFFQSEDVYYALFGEGVTESLRNCLVYDTEIEAIYLAGDFGVYGKKMVPGETPGVLLGFDFFITEPSKTVKNLITDGYPFFSGTIILHRTLELKQRETILEFQGRFQTLTVWVNGQNAGMLICHNRLDISEHTKVGTNEIVIELTVSNRNMLGPHHYLPCEEPVAVGPFVFELPNSWKNGKSLDYREDYSFVSVEIC